MNSSPKPQKTEYANQHYVPKLLLKRFSYEDKINIGLMSASSGKVRSPIPYKPQCAKHYFYGKDLFIEKKLGEIEDETGKIIDLISSISDPHIDRSSRAHILLTIFAVYQYVRTDKALKLAEEVVEKNYSIAKEHAKPNLMLKLAETANGQLSEQELSEFYDNVTVSMTNPHSIMFESANSIILPSLQLEMKLLINDTEIPLIISDNPLVYMDAESEDCFYRMLLPLTPKLLLVFYDGRKYKIGLRKANFHKLTNETDVFYLNVLQYLNCQKNIYFGPGTPTKHLMSLNRSFKKLRANEATTLTELNGRAFLKTNRPKVNHRFSFVKRIASLSNLQD